MEAVKNTVRWEIVGLDDRIGNIEKFAEKLEEIKEIEKVLLKPDLKDVSTICLIYDWVEELCANRSDIESFKYDTRHYFLLISALVYSPRIFAKKTLERGKRNIIASVLRISPCHVSNSLKSVCYWYRIYGDFRKSFKYLYNEILNRIEINGLR